MGCIRKLPCPDVAATSDVRGIVVSLWKPSTSRLCDGLGPGQYLLQADDITFKYFFQGFNRKFSAHAFSLVGAWAMTGHKVQGQSLGRVIISHFLEKEDTRRPGFRRRVRITKGWLYVAMSRVSRLTDLFLTSRVLLDMVKAREDLQCEFARLKFLDLQTRIRCEGSSPVLLQQADAAFVRYKHMYDKCILASTAKNQGIKRKHCSSSSTFHAGSPSRAG